VKRHRFSSVMGAFGSCADRYVLDGYTPKRDFDEMLERARQVPDLTGLELVGGWHLKMETAEEDLRKVLDAGFEVSMLIPELWSQGKWGWGTFSSRDPKIREEAIEQVKKTMDLAAMVGCNQVSPWFGHDGFDYVFQSDYIKEWDMIVEGLIECADYRPDVKIAVEYKVREPRMRAHVNSLGTALLLVQEVNRPNVGINLDIGHALQGFESMAQSVALLKRFGDKLFHLHLNDNYRTWDDDMMPASVHTLETIELLYWLERTGYDGWYSLDVFPYREDGVEIVTEGIEWYKGIFRLIDRIGMDTLGELIEEGNPIKTLSVIRKELLP
jgi:xylose isomerase